MIMKQTLRSLKIIYIVTKYRLFGLGRRFLFFRFLNFLGYINPASWFAYRYIPAERAYLACEELGPIFVKFGQILSTRGDFLPEDISVVLSKLQDRVKPFPSVKARLTIENALKQPISEIFSEFSDAPLASASIAQVHAARLQSGEEVVVKVVRPNIGRIVDEDLALLNTLVQVLQFFSKSMRQLKMLDLVGELERSIKDELNLLKEAANASTIRRNFIDSGILYIPKIYWHYCRRDILVMERIYGVSINDKATLIAKGVDLKELAQEGIKIFYTQVFRDAYFHADMHPGNVFIDVDNEGKATWIAVDFGMMGSLGRQDQHYLAANFLAFINRDYRRVAKLHVESGWVPRNVRMDVLETAIRTVCEPIFEQPLNEVSFGETLYYLLEIARMFHMQLQPQLLLLQKSLVNIEGVARQLDPHADIWATSRPILESWMREQLGLKGLMQRFKEEWPLINEKLPDLPHLLYRKLMDDAMMIEMPKEPPKVQKSERIKQIGLGMGVGLLAIGALDISHIHFHPASLFAIGGLISLFFLWI